VGHLTFTNSCLPPGSISRTVNLHVIGCSMTVQQPNTRLRNAITTTTFTHEERRCVHRDTFSAAQVNNFGTLAFSFTYSPVQGTLIPAGGTVTVTANISGSPAAGEFADIVPGPLRWRAHNIDVIPSAPADSSGGPYHAINVIPSSRYYTMANWDHRSKIPAGPGFRFEVAQGRGTVVPAKRH